LREKKSVVVGPCSFGEGHPDANYVPDNTNADCEVRKRWIELAAKHSVPIRCVHFTAPTEICEHNDAVRALNKSVCDPSHQLALDPNEAFLHA
jgi:bifunctional polynucleotide phosphatase/kinase